MNRYVLLTLILVVVGLTTPSTTHLTRPRSCVRTTRPPQRDERSTATQELAILSVPTLGWGGKARVLIR